MLYSNIKKEGAIFDHIVPNRSGTSTDQTRFDGKRLSTTFFVKSTGLSEHKILNIDIDQNFIFDQTMSGIKKHSGEGV